MISLGSKKAKHLVQKKGVGGVIKSIALLSFSLLITNTQAQDLQTNLQESLLRDSFEIGPEVFYHRYEETDEGGFLMMEETGVMYGFFLDYTHRNWIPRYPRDEELRGGLMLTAQTALSYGKVNYDGQLQDGTPYTMSGIDDSIWESRFLIGADIPKSYCLATLYSGIGYRYWNDNSSSDPAGYERESSYLYLPLGVTALREGKSGWICGPTFEFDILIVGEQKSHLGDFGLGTVTNRQNSGYGFRFSYEFRKAGPMDFTIEPFIRYWHIAKSDVETVGATTIVEPENETLQAGIRLIWRF
jgi:hypothetical protein